MLSLSGLIKGVFGEQYDFYIPAGQALLYLVRRFGYTPYGSDSHKQICQYRFGTSVNGLEVVIGVGGIHAFFYSSSSDEVSDKYHNELLAYRHKLQKLPISEPGTFMYECQEATKNVLLDLLKPVRVRDSFINILGVVNPEYDEEIDTYKNEVPCFHAAGNGVPTGWYESTDTLWEFDEFLERIGNGSYVNGMKFLMEKHNENRNME